MTEDQRELIRCRVDAAARQLNEALDDAHRFGLRSRVSPNGSKDQETVRVTLMRPVELQLTKEGARRDR